MGIGDWGLGPIPNPQSPIPNPQSPRSFIKFFFFIFQYLKYLIFYISNQKIIERILNIKNKINLIK